MTDLKMVISFLFLLVDSFLRMLFFYLGASLRWTFMRNHTFAEILESGKNLNWLLGIVFWAIFIYLLELI